MRSLSFKTRLWLGQVSLLAAMLALAAFGADWALRSVVLGRVDDELLSLATLESATLEDDPPLPLRAREIAPDPPSFLRLNKLVQVAEDQVEGGAHHRPRLVTVSDVTIESRSRRMAKVTE